MVTRCYRSKGGKVRSRARVAVWHRAQISDAVELPRRVEVHLRCSRRRDAQVLLRAPGLVLLKLNPPTLQR